MLVRAIHQFNNKPERSLVAGLQREDLEILWVVDAGGARGGDP